jgi:hypothetical protein
MATRKTNTETKQVVSAGAASSPSKTRPRRTATTARSKRSAAAAEKPLPPAEDLKTETPSAVLNISLNSVEPSPGEIARLAYLYWLDRGCQSGSADEDWFRAEQELRQQAIG